MLARRSSRLYHYILLNDGMDWTPTVKINSNHTFGKLKKTKFWAIWYFQLSCNAGYSKFVGTQKSNKIFNYMSSSHWWEIPRLIFKNIFFYPSLVSRQPVLYNWDTVWIRNQASYYYSAVIHLWLFNVYIPSIWYTSPLNPEGKGFTSD